MEVSQVGGELPLKADEAPVVAEGGGVGLIYFIYSFIYFLKAY